MLLTPLLLALGAASAAAGGDPPSPPPNVLVLLADDIGVGQLASYGKGVWVPSTPNLDAMAAEGVRFTRAWSPPICSPTRATIHTGRFGFRTGIGWAFDSTGAGVGLHPSEVTLPELLDGVYAHAAFGKWHLAGGLSGPNDAGWDHFAGTMGNLGGQGYFTWTKVTDGVESQSSVYATSDVVDDALAWIATAPEPWIAYVSFHAAHTPAHAPPDGMYEVDLTGAPHPRREPRPYYKAMIEALDLEIGRLVQGLGEAQQRTAVLFLADNGTEKQMLDPGVPPHQSKYEVYEGGVNVPLIAWGGAVAGVGVCEALVCTVDLYATIADLAGVDLAATLPPGHALDAVSFAPHLADPAAPSARPWAYTETFTPIGPGPPAWYRRAIRDERYKLIATSDDPAELYDLVADPNETTDLLAAPLDPEAQAAYDTLSAELAGLLGAG